VYLYFLCAQVSLATSFTAVTIVTNNFTAVAIVTNSSTAVAMAVCTSAGYSLRDLCVGGL